MTTVITIQAAAQNGTSGALAGDKYARSLEAWVMQRTGDQSRGAAHNSRIWQVWRIERIN